MFVFPKNAEKNASIIEKGLLCRRPCRRRVHAPTRITASQVITMGKSTDGFPFLSYMSMGLRLADPRSFAITNNKLE